MRMPGWEESAWVVTPDILELIPAEIRLLMHCSPDHPFLVLRNWDLVEVCAGRARILRWASLVGLQGCALDRSYNAPHMDLVTDEGFALALVCIMRIKPRGLVIMGPQCSS